MKSKTILTLYFNLLIFLTALISCSDSESRMSPLLRHSTVVINLGLPPENPTAYDNTILNRIRRFFVPDAIAQSAPATFSNILVRVSGPDIGIIEQDFGPLGTISLDVPAGNLRQFEVIASVSPLDPSGAASFRGTATANLPEGETVSIPVVMTLFEAKLVIPDNFNQRIVKINSMAGDGWVERLGTDIGFAGFFEPYDVDFDSRGRIYIANGTFVSAQNVVIRLNNLDDTVPIMFGPGGSTGLTAIAVDRVRNYVYYAQSSALFRANLDGTGNGPVSIPGSISLINGLDVDQASGDLFMACFYNPVRVGQPAVLRLSITGSVGNILASQNLVAGTSWDVAVKPPVVFVTEAFSSQPDPRNRVIQFDTGLTTPVATAPFLTRDPSATQDFFGPGRFIAPMNRRLTVIDEDQGANTFDRLTGFDDISGTNWSTYGTTGSGVGQFVFFFFRGS